jgi:7-cyano-7-deazaguanine synthase
MKKRSVIILSGGIDSAVLLHTLFAEGQDVTALTFSYNQRHRKEVEYARRTAERLKVSWLCIDAEKVFAALRGDSALMNEKLQVPHGHFAAEPMKGTVVPNRNMIFLAIAIGHAVSEKRSVVYYGAHAGDHTIYPDCRPEFVETMQRAAKLCDWQKIELCAPFLHWSKGKVVAEGSKLGVNFLETWTCYEGGQIHCGQCGSCNERKEAFRAAGVADPTAYQL